MELRRVCRYSHAATGPDEKEEWIRKVPLLVLIYEGIVNNVYDYDYAPGVPLPLLHELMWCSLGGNQPAPDLFQHQPGG